MPIRPMRLNRTRRRAFNGLAVTRPGRETVPAVYRFVAARLKRNLCHAAALAAGSPEHLALGVAAATRSAAAAAGGFTCSATVAASTRFVCKSFTRKELLFARREGKRASAIDAVKGFVGVHLSLLTLLVPVANDDRRAAPARSPGRILMCCRLRRPAIEDKVHNARARSHPPDERAPLCDGAFDATVNVGVSAIR